jgi:hypothetical protein
VAPPPFRVLRRRANATFIVLSSTRSDDAVVSVDKTVVHPPADPAGHKPTLAGLLRRRGWELHPGVRSHARLSVSERAADTARDVAGSWTFVVAAGGWAAVGIVEAVQHDRQVGPVAVLGLVLSGMALVGLSLVLMAARRADRIAGEVAVHQLDSDRRAAAGIEELRDEVEQLRGDLAWLTARLETSAGRARWEETR